MNIAAAIEEISQEKRIDIKTIVKALEETMELSAKKIYKDYKEIEARYENNDIHLFYYKKVVNEVQDKDNEISLEIAKKVDTTAQIDDEIEYEIKKDQYINVLAQTFRQGLFQKIKEYENQFLEAKYRDKVGKIVSGQVERVTREKCIIALDNSASATLEYKEQIPGERLSIGDSINALLFNIEQIDKRVFLKLSRTHPNFLRELFRLEIPEVDNEDIEVLSIARDPGKRAKVIVNTDNSDIDPVGSCIGKGGSRIQVIINEINGEKIDVIRWNNSIKELIMSAMVPAELRRVEVDEENFTADIFVDEDNLALAIGQKGQNIKLASRLTKFELNIKTLETEKETTEEVPEIQVFSGEKEEE